MSATPPASTDRTLMIVLAYAWPLAVVPLLVQKEDRDVQWHAKHGLFLLGTEIVVWILCYFLAYAMPFGLGCVVIVVPCAASVVIRILAIIKALAGERFRIPVISGFADKF